MSESVLEMNGVKKRYPGKGSRGEVHALRGVSLSVGKGEFVALHGPSGCGKSTLLLAAGGLLRPDVGTIAINGQDLYSLNNSNRARFRAANLGFVFQQFHLIPYLDVLGNLMVTEVATGQSANAKKRAEAILEQFGMAARAGHHPSELSVGEQQRLALARAVFANASILFADEPTGNLDRDNATIVLDYMKEFAGNGGVVVMVTHDDRALEHASQKVSLVDGRIKE
ncbi:ABC transporter ATP-binding protein YtrE [Planctomycetes bacterium CA13]|uniref:ABC transporter ATP-binding protein YtrE n=1 Tax=Novipirellula herctigrandis TaxID=2527986 RepID=A0A5C5Z9S9_9BACT|nr:ABC transporter ATP-binding protein YtrE [Planctomycetes bacterium CA13]